MLKISNYWSNANQNYRELTHQSECHHQKLETINDGKGLEKTEPSYTVGGNVNWYSRCGEQYRRSLKTKNKESI